MPNDRKRRLPDEEVEIFGVRGILQAHRGKPARDSGYRRAADDCERDVDEAKVHSLLERRARAKAARDFTTADAMREELRAMGIDVFDKDKVWRVRGGGGGGTKELNVSLAHHAHHALPIPASAHHHGRPPPPPGAASVGPTGHAAPGRANGRGRRGRRGRGGPGGV